ncbi:hypothetical protein RUND412_000539 [Rhizina undulata]
MHTKPTVLVLGTCDTKLTELLYLKSLLTPTCNVILTDVGRTPVPHPLIDIPQSRVLEDFPLTPIPDLASASRDTVVSTLAAAATAFVPILQHAQPLHGAISLGGSSGTSIAATVMRSLPVGFPKLIVSTMASGDTYHYVRATDITMMYSIVDILGLNSILTPIISNAANAISGMAAGYLSRLEKTAASTEKPKTTVGITMFGITTPAVEAAKRVLESRGDNMEVLIFHATGSGGRAMESLVASGRISAVLDLTTTELADELVGGILSAGPDRLTAASKAGIPQIVAPGALDCVNFGAFSTVPKRYRGRRLVQHNPAVTLMRTNSEECERLGDIFVDKILRHVKNRDMVEVWIPSRGLSTLSEKGGAFEDRGADAAFVDAVKRGLLESGVRVVSGVGEGINDGVLAEKAAMRLLELLELKSQKMKRGGE